MTAISKRDFLKYGGTALGAGLMASVLGPMGARAQSKALTVAWWGEGDQNKRTAAAMTAFASNSGISIDPQGTNFNGYFDRLATQIAGGSPPDVFQVYLASMAEYAKRGTVAPLGDYLGKTIDTSDWEDAAVNSMALGDTKFYVPLGLSTQPAIIYDKTVFDSIGITALDPNWTLDEFKETCLKVAKALSTNGKKAYGCDDLGGQQTVLEAFIRSKGKNMFSEEGKLGFTKEDLTEWYAFWDEARASGMAVAPEARKQGGFEASPIITGTAPIVQAASAKGLQGFQSLTKNDLNFNPWPRYSKDVDRVQLVTPVEWMVISANSSQKDQAAELLNFLTNDPAAITAMGISHGVPVNKKLRQQIMDSGKLSDVERKIYKDTADALPYSTRPRVIYPAGSTPLVGPTTPLITQLNDQIAFKRMDVKSAVDRFFGEADRNL
ncbi:MAG TPA: ABC transporter substrate-binding protein [Devosiaceae bacterium]|jgi:multiple sugar transport system substrate-binding protein